MLVKKMRTIKAEGREYPIFCDFNVLEYIQEKYGSIEVYQMKVAGLKKNRDGRDYVAGAVNVRAVLDGLQIMINEGIDIQNDNKADTQEHVSKSDVGRILRMAELPLGAIPEIILNEISDCVLPKKKEPEKKENLGKRRRLTLHGYSMLELICSVIRRRK